MKFFRAIFISVFVILVMSCNMFASSKPYLISGEMVIDPDYYDDDATFVFSLYNKSEKSIASFTVVFYLFDEDGNCPMSNRSNITNKITAEIEPDEKFESSFSLTKYLSVLPDEPYLVDYLYLSQIIYSDGTVWNDRFGMQSF